MRKISNKATFQFFGMTCSNLIFAYFCTLAVTEYFPSDFRGILVLVSALVLFYLSSIFMFAIQQHVMPIPYGFIKPGSVGEHSAFVYMLHYIILFNPVIFSRLLPFPILGLFLKLLGAKIGRNSFCSGLMMDPQFVRVGNNSLIGNDAMLISHIIEGDILAYEPIVIGNNVTIGARAIIMAGVVIEDDAIVGVQSVVLKGTVIGKGQTWVGCPARCTVIR